MLLLERFQHNLQMAKSRGDDDNDDVLYSKSGHFDFEKLTVTLCESFEFFKLRRICYFFTIHHHDKTYVLQLKLGSINGKAKVVAMRITQLIFRVGTNIAFCNCTCKLTVTWKMPIM